MCIVYIHEQMAKIKFYIYVYNRSIVVDGEQTECVPIRQVYSWYNDNIISYYIVCSGKYMKNVLNTRFLYK